MSSFSFVHAPTASASLASSVTASDALSRIPPLPEDLFRTIPTMPESATHRALEHARTQWTHSLYAHGTEWGKHCEEIRSFATSLHTLDTTLAHSLCEVTGQK